MAARWDSFSFFVALPVFQAHRAFIVNERGMLNAESAQNISKAFQLSIESEKLAASDSGFLFERSSVKSSVEMIVSRTSKDAPYEHGYTLIPLATAFIPRLI